MRGGFLLFVQRGPPLGAGDCKHARRGKREGREAEDLRTEIDREHRKPRAVLPRFRTKALEEEFKLEAEIDTIIPHLPLAAVRGMRP